MIRRGGRVGIELVGLDDNPHARREGHARVHTRTEPPDRGDGDRLGIAKDTGGRVHTERWIERHRQRAEAHGAEERVEELRAGRINQTDLVAGADAGRREARRVARTLRPEPRVRHRLVEEREVLGVGRQGRPAPHHFDERGCSLRVKAHS